MDALNIHQFGNKVDFQGRTTLELEENGTGSYIPKGFLMQEKPGEKNRHLPISNIRKIEYNTPNFLEAINQFATDIKDHVETKIQLFFYQLLLVNGLGLKFFQDKAYYQAGVNTKKETAQANLDSDFKAVEARCATLVTILAADSKKYENCFLSDDNPIERVFFGDGTFYGRSWNMTVTLPSCVNTQDSAFEWQHKDNKKYAGKTFRQCCVKILNNVSKGKLTSVDGLGHYLLKGIHYLESVKQEVGIPDYKTRISDIYLEVFEKYVTFLSGEDRDRVMKALTFTVLSPEKENLQSTHDFMFGKLKEEFGVQTTLRSITQRIQISLGISANNYKDLRILTNGVALERTSSDITRWIGEYIAEKNLQTTDTSAKYVKLCIKDAQFNGLAVQYLNGKTVDQLKANIKAGIKVAPLKALADRIKDVCAPGNKVIQNKLTILLHSLHHAAKFMSEPTPRGLGIRQVLCLNDSMMHSFLEGHPKRKEDIRKACSDPAVRELVGNL